MLVCLPSLKLIHLFMEVIIMVNNQSSDPEAWELVEIVGRLWDESAG